MQIISAGYIIIHKIKCSMVQTRKQQSRTVGWNAQLRAGRTGPLEMAKVEFPGFKES